MTTTGTVARLISAYVKHNSFRADVLPALIESVAKAIDAFDKSPTAAEPATKQLAPAVNPRRSVKRNAIIFLDCGRPMKVPKGHIRFQHRLSPDAYRRKWRRSPDYPMVALA